MEDDAQALEEVVVIGYGTVQKKDLTGSVSSVSAKQLESIPVSSASEALQGKMAGVQITTTEGSPDAEVKIRVRGGGSLSQDNSPLYIVDGFPVSSISDIAPTDIQSVDVLKMLLLLQFMVRVVLMVSLSSPLNPVQKEKLK